MQVIIKPLPNKRWHDKEGKDAFARPNSTEVLIDAEKGVYATGLTDEEAEEYGKKLGLNLSNTVSYTEGHPYWASVPAKLALPLSTLIFNTEKPHDFVKVKNYKAHKLVANSFKEWEDGNWPEATHYIFDEEEETSAKASKVQNRNKAVKAIMGMSLDEKVNMVRLLSTKSVSGRSQDFIDVELDAVINTDDGLRDFILYYQMDKAEMNIRAKVTEALSKNILTKEGNAVLYMGEKLGYDFDDTVKYFLDPNNQNIKLVIFDKITTN